MATDTTPETEIPKAFKQRSLLNIELDGVDENGNSKANVTFKPLTREDAIILVNVCRKIADNIEGNLNRKGPNLKKEN